MDAGSIHIGNVCSGRSICLGACHDSEGRIFDIRAEENLIDFLETEAAESESVQQEAAETEKETIETDTEKGTSGIGKCRNCCYGNRRGRTRNGSGNSSGNRNRHAGRIGGSSGK